MSNSSKPANPVDNWFNKHAPAPFKTNRRMGIRYARNDIGASVLKIGLFNFSFRANQGISVKIIDISSRGVLVAMNPKLPVNKKITLTIRFADFKEFQIPGKVVRKSEGSVVIYGIKFDHPSNELADYLLATQRKLTFT